VTPDDADHAAQRAAETIRAIPDPIERARLATSLLADLVDVALSAAESTPDPAERARLAADATRTLHDGRERALAARRHAVRQALRDGWPDSDLSRATGVPQPRIAEARKRARAEGEPVPTSRQAWRSARSTRSGDTSGRGGQSGT
jgi:hypothetical protein